MESSLRLESERICFENGNLISLISNKSSHLEGMALTLQWGSTRHRGRVKFVFEVNGIYRGNLGAILSCFCPEKAACISLDMLFQVFVFVFFTKIRPSWRINESAFSTTHVVHPTCSFRIRCHAKYSLLMGWWFTTAAFLIKYNC